MRVPLSWLREYVDLADGVTGVDVAASLVSVGLEEEGLHGGEVTGPLVVGRVLDFVEEPQKNGKTIRWCQVDVGEHGQRLTDGGLTGGGPQGVVCGARNFAVGDLVVVVLPGGVLAGGIQVSARRTYGHVSAGMICSERELGLSQEHGGILVLEPLLGKAVSEVKPGDDAIALLGLADEVVEVNVTPDRGYCLSMRGVAREYAAATGATFRDPAALAAPDAADDGFPVRLGDESPLLGRRGCDRYVARVLRGVDAARPSPPWMQRRLTQTGMRPISLAVDVTNYVMLALGQPLHAFDVSTLEGPIVVRRARAGERLTTLDGVDRTLSEEDLLITDAGERPLVIAGVMGGVSSEVGPATTDVLVEAAHFDPTTVARSSRRHRLVTEASRRFERGVDPDLPQVAAQLALDLLQRYGGGAPDSGGTDADQRSQVTPILLDPGLPARLVGLPYSTADVVESLRDVGCEVDEQGGSEYGRERRQAAALSVLPPSWRPDLRDGPDLVEEVVRLRGYDRVPSVPPRPVGGHGLSHGQLVRRVVARTLAARGFVEVLTYPFVSSRSHDDLGLPRDDPRRVALRVANPLSEQAPLLRTSLLSTLVDAARRNLSRGSSDLALFEIGLVTRPSPEQPKAPVPGIDGRPDEETLETIRAAVPHQPRRLAVLLMGDAEHAGWWGPGRAADWSDAVTAVTSVADALALEVVVSADEHPPWHPGRCGRLTLVDGTLVGHAGELHPSVLAALRLPPRTCAAEVDLGSLIAASDRAVQAESLSSYPLAHSDVALVVADAVPAAAVEFALREGAGALLESLRLFDVYRGGQVAAARKSLAYRLSFRAPDRTLTTEEVNALRDQAVARAADTVGAVQR